MMMLFSLHNIQRKGQAGFVALLLVLTAAASLHYPGEWYVYLIFSVISNYLLFAGFTKNAIFFDTFIGVFFWLGFWFKTTFKLIFSDGVFKEAVGQFDGSGDAFDRAIIVVTVAFIGLLIARWIRYTWMFSYQDHSENVRGTGLFKFYERNRKKVLVGFVVTFVAIAISNAWLGIYQRGEIPKTILPFGLNGIYTWLLLFGLASVSAVLMRMELALNPGKQNGVSLIALFEVFVSNVSLLSRGMLLNVFALFYGLYRLVTNIKVQVNLKQVMIVSVAFVVLFSLSILTVNYLRYDKHANEAARIVQAKISQSQDPKNSNDFGSIHKAKLRQLLIDMTSRLLVDRWVGMEGVLAISSSPKLGWDLFDNALRERFSHNETSFYDLNMIRSPYLKTDKTRHHYISLPGAVAFFFYPGSHGFLFMVMIAIGLVAASIELCVYHLGGKNLILCALMSQVVAFRLSSFGYVPSQSYLLIGTVFLNVLMIYSLNLVLNKYCK